MIYNIKTDPIFGVDIYDKHVILGGWGNNFPKNPNNTIKAA